MNSSNKRNNIWTRSRKPSIQQQQQQPKSYYTTEKTTRKSADSICCSRSTVYSDSNHNKCECFNNNNGSRIYAILSFWKKQRLWNRFIQFLLFCIIVCITLLFLQIILQFIQYNQRHIFYNDNESVLNRRKSMNNTIDMSKISPCTFLDLYTSFGNIQKLQQQLDRCNDNSSMNTVSSSSSCCWNLHEMIVRIPVQSIVLNQLNNDDTIDTKLIQKLGGGRRGGVYQVIIDLYHNNTNNDTNPQQEQPNQYCSVAIKTDYCTTQSTLDVMITDSKYYFKKLLSTIQKRIVSTTKSTTSVHVIDQSIQNIIGSCILPNSRLYDRSSFVASEYAGSLIYYSQLLREIDQLRRQQQQNGDASTTSSSSTAPYIQLQKQLQEAIYNLQKRQQQDRQKHDENNHSRSFYYIGLLPTYGIIVSEKPLTNVYTIPRRFWSGLPIRQNSYHNKKNGLDNSIGVVMPLLQQQPLEPNNSNNEASSQKNDGIQFDSIANYNFRPENLTRAKMFHHSVHELNYNISLFIQVFLPTAIELEYVNTNLRLAYQDIKEKNIGILYTNNNGVNTNIDNGNNTIFVPTITVQSSLLFDHSYIGSSAVDKHDTETTACKDISCRYCYENVFPIANRKIDLFVDTTTATTNSNNNDATIRTIDNRNKKYDNIQSDYMNFRRVLLDILNHCPINNSKECIQLRTTIQNNATSISQLVRILQNYDASSTTMYPGTK